jgi:hypothetical protein
MRLTKSVSVESLSLWWPIPLFVAINLLLGLVLGILLTWFLSDRCQDLKVPFVYAVLCVCVNTWLPATLHVINTCAESKL